MLITDKLQELNSKMGDGSHHVDDNALGEIIKLADLQGSPDLTSVSMLRKMLEWPQGEMSHKV